MRSRPLAAVLLLALSLTACSGSSKNDTSPTASPSASQPTRISTTGSLQIISPTPGQVVKGTKLTVRVKVAGATISTSPQATKKIRPDEGHLHIKVDGETKTILAGASYDLTGLTKGRHILIAEFVAGDHVPFNPRVLTTVPFTVT